MELIKRSLLFFLIIIAITGCSLNKYNQYEGRLSREIGDDLLNKIAGGQYGEVEAYLDYLAKKKPQSINGL